MPPSMYYLKSKSLKSFIAYVKQVPETVAIFKIPAIIAALNCGELCNSMGDIQTLPTGGSQRQKSSSLKSVVKLLISLGLLGIVYGKADLQTLLHTLLSVSPVTAFSVALLYALSQIITCSKWWVILKNAGIERESGETLRAHVLGMFVNTFGLGTLGGDVVRSVAIRPQKGKRAAALASVFVDRIQGLAVLASIGALAILFVQPPVLGWIAPVLALPAIAIIVCALWFGPRLITKFIPQHTKLYRLASETRRAFPENASTQLLVTRIAIGFHCIQIFTYYIISNELGTGMSLAYLFATVPLINIASTLPLSINGLGIRDSLCVILFGAAGVSHETAIAFSAIWVLALTMVSAIGGAIASYLPGETLAEAKHDAEVQFAEIEEERRVAQG